MGDVELLNELRQRLEELRCQLDRALGDAGGDLQNETARRLAEEFDRVLSEYLKASAQQP